MIRAKLKDLAVRFQAELPFDFEYKPHVYPKYRSPVLRNNKLGRREIVSMQFALIPFFEKSDKPKKVFHNARSETVHEKPMFRKLFTTRRCIVPIDSFFEFIWTDEKTNWLGRFYEKSDRPLQAAGLWDAWKSPKGESIQSYTILTREPHPFILKTGHDRMPLFLSDSAIDPWLNESESKVENLFEILKDQPKLEFDVEKLKK